MSTMPKRIRIGSITFQTTNATLNTAFSPFGTLTSCNVILDAAGGSTGTAEAEYTTDEAAASAAAAMNGATIDGSVISVVNG